LSEWTRLALQAAVYIALARLLPVDAFGVFALSMIGITLFLRSAELGTAAALIQRPELTDRHVRVAFSLALSSGAAMTTIVWLAAPAIAAVCRNEAVLPVLRVLSVLFVLSTLGTTAEALLERRMDYRRLFRVDLAAYACGFTPVGLGVAVWTHDHWALASAAVAHAAVRTVLLLRSAPHPWRPLLSRVEAGQLLSFGAGSTLNRLASYAASTVDAFIVGRWLGAPALGLYSRAQQLTSLPTGQVAAVLNAVLFPAYSQIQGERARVRRGYLAAVSLVSLVAFPLLAALAVAPEELLIVVLGHKWGSASVALQILCIGGMCQSVANLGDSVARSAAAVYSKAAYQGIYAAAVTAGALLGLSWGIAGVAAGVTLAMAVAYVLMAALSLRLTGATWRRLLAAQRPGGIVAATVFGAGALTAGALRAGELDHAVVLGASLGAGAAAGLGTLRVLPRRWFDPAVTDALAMLRRRAAAGGAKKRIKHCLRRWPAAYKAAEIAYENTLYIPHVLRQHLVRQALGIEDAASRQGGQRVLTWRVRFPAFDDPRDLLHWLRAEGFDVREGGHTLYLPPQPRLRTLLPQVVEFYPPNAGFKVLRDFREPAAARYLYRHRSTLPLLARLMDSPAHQLLVANYMHALGIGPRVWDVTCWRTAGLACTVFVVDHVAGDEPCGQACYAHFMRRLAELEAGSELRVLVPAWREHPDFAEPDCGGNLVYSREQGRALYVDFQNFGLRDRRLAWRRSQDGRDADGSSVLPVAIDDRVVIGAGHATAPVIAEALSRGAAWGLVGCTRAKAAATRDWLIAAGASRFSIVQCDGWSDSAAVCISPGVRRRLSDAVIVRPPEAAAEAARLLAFIERVTTRRVAASTADHREAAPAVP
jgi:PST family polysaccharide transporter